MSELHPLDEFSTTADTSTLEAFLRSYPWPALTVRFADPHAPPPDLSATADEESMTALLGDPRQRSHVAFLVKSERNPFGSIISVGRSPQNDICLPQRSVSKVHATFSKVGDTWRVTDRTATHGLFVDRIELPPGESAELDDGTLISFGTDVEATFHQPAGLWDYVAWYQRRRG